MLVEIDKWDKLARAFYNQYKFNIDAAISIWDLSNMRRKKVETFKGYAQRWRSLDARVNTLLPEKDLAFTFVNTLEEPFFSHIIGHSSTSFSKIVMTRCRNESTISSEKL